MTNKIFVEGIEAGSAFPAPSIRLSVFLPRLTFKKEYWTSFAIDDEITVDCERFYYVSIYEKVKSLVNQKMILNAILKEKSRKFLQNLSF